MIPDFFIVGAMKAGTTTLWDLLNHHPEICMSVPKEPVIIDRDDALQSPHFFYHYSREWSAVQWKLQKEHIADEYNRIFLHRTHEKICGEATTTYLASKKAPERIFDLNKNAKIIVLLRNPVDRAYSHYWHLVRTGWAVYPFEKQIYYEPYNILERGMYKEQLERYYHFFDQNNVLVLLYEEFCKEMQVGAKKIFDFLGVDHNQFDEASWGNQRRNIARVPRSLYFQLFLNRLKRIFGTTRYQINCESARPNRLQNCTKRIFDKIVDLNLTAAKRYFKMTPETRQQLEEFYRRENEGLDTLIGNSLDCWPFWSQRRYT